MSLDLDLFMEVDTGGAKKHEVELFSTNITHNVGKMAQLAGIYDCLWRPEEHGIETAQQLIEPLTHALIALHDNPTIFTEVEASNGWGTYEQFLPWVEELFQHCCLHPKAKVKAWR